MCGDNDEVIYVGPPLSEEEIRALYEFTRPVRIKDKKFAVYITTEELSKKDYQP